MAQGMDAKNKKDEGKVRLNMWITRRQHEELRELASFDGRTVSDLIRQVLGSFLRDKDGETYNRSK